jgi:hypothetical protein
MACAAAPAAWGFVGGDAPRSTTSASTAPTDTDQKLRSRAATAPITTPTPAQLWRERRGGRVKAPIHARLWCAALPGRSDAAPSTDLVHQCSFRSNRGSKAQIAPSDFISFCAPIQPGPSLPPIVLDFPLHGGRGRVLDLQPAVSAAGSIGRAEALRHDALATESAGGR